MTQKKAAAQFAALTITTLLAASHASAVTFASFGFTGGNSFALSNNSFSASETGTFSSAVNFAPGYGNSPFSAIFTLTGTLVPGSGSAITLNSTPNTTSISQGIGSLSFSIIGTSGAAAGKNLLSGSLLTTTGDSLQGNVNNSTQTSTASIGASGTEANINYSSDIYSFLPGSRDMTMTLNNIRPPVLSVTGTTSPLTTTIPGLGTITIGTITTGNINDFFADASLNFGATPGPNPGPPLPGTVPEPGTVAMLFGMGVSGMAFGLRSRRKK